MTFNYDKCIHITLHQTQSSVRYLNGALVPRKQQALHLGTILSDTIDTQKDKLSPIAEAMVTCNRLRLFWGKAINTIKWKATVFNPVLRSRVLYGLETIQVTTSDISKLNAFQKEGLRRIPHLQHTFIGRAYSNQRVLDILRNTHHIYVEKFSDTGSAGR